MSLRSVCARVLTLTLFALPLCAEAQVKLEVKVPDDKKSTAAVKVSTSQILTIAGMPIETGSKQQMEISTLNGKRNEEGVIRQQQKIESLKAEVTLPGGITLEYDSAQPNAPAPGTQFDFILELLKVNDKATWTVVRGKDNRVTAIEGRDKVLEGLDETKKALLQKQLDPTYLREAANKELDKLPSMPVKEGDSWELSETMRLEGGQTLTFKTKFTYQGTIDRNGKQLDKIESEVTEVSYGIDADAGAPLKVASAELKPEKSSGLILFDREAGTTVESRSMLQIKGTINFEQNGNAIPAQLDLTMNTSSVTS